MIALVTGGDKGIGFETWRNLADAGRAVLLGARKTDEGARPFTSFSKPTSD
jgi:NAD(P)-dependent dehydrogenase (short-subunit alcohol dehydrogenase family)